MDRRFVASPTPEETWAHKLRTLLKDLETVINAKPNNVDGKIIFDPGSGGTGLLDLSRPLTITAELVTTNPL